MWEMIQLFAYAVVTTIVFVALLWVDLPALYEWFNIETLLAEPLWPLAR